MLKLNYSSLHNRADWEKAGITLPRYDWKEMQEATRNAPTWVHFGSGNIFRGFIARLQHTLLNEGLVSSGIITAGTYDHDNIDLIYRPHDCLTILVQLLPDGSMKKEVVASIADALKIGPAFPDDTRQLRKLFSSPSLQMVSFTITEKGYALRDLQGEFFPDVQADFRSGPASCSHAMSIVTSMLLERFRTCRTPLALVSMDNCSHNGDKLRSSILTVAEHWLACGFVPAEFPAWIQENVSFPWSMIDKITPRPAEVVEKALLAAGVSDMARIVTPKKTFAAPFVNAEVPEYLVIEDDFPNGRPPLEKAGVYFADRNTVNLTEKMKVTTCLYPLHTALAVYGCLLGYTSIAAEMKDPHLKALAEGIGFREGLPVVTDPGIIRPEDFLREVVEERLPNPFIPDAPQRIATDTSQKIPIRFGETIKSYAALGKADTLELIPLAIAGWLRYLLAVDDAGKPMACSADPMLSTLQEQLASVTLGKPATATQEVLRPILSSKTLFGCDLYEVHLADNIRAMLTEMLAGPGAVRACLSAHL